MIRQSFILKWLFTYRLGWFEYKVRCGHVQWGFYVTSGLFVYLRFIKYTCTCVIKNTNMVNTNDAMCMWMIYFKYSKSKRSYSVDTDKNDALVSKSLYRYPLSLSISISYVCLYIETIAVSWRQWIDYHVTEHMLMREYISHIYIFLLFFFFFFSFLFSLDAKILPISKSVIFHYTMVNFSFQGVPLNPNTECHVLN